MKMFDRLRPCDALKPGFELTAEIWARCNIGIDLWEGVSLAKIPDSCEHKSYLRAWCENAAEATSGGHGLLLLGPTRQGKSSAAVMCCEAVLRAGGWPFFTRADDLVSAVMKNRRWNSDQSYEDRAMDSHVLVLDDVGAGAGRDQASGIIERIVRNRLADRRALIVTAHGLARLKEWLGEPTTLALLEACTPVACEGTNFHAEKARAEVGWIEAKRRGKPGASKP